MKRKNPVAVVTTWLALALAPAHDAAAADANTAARAGSGGTVIGRVQNVITGQHLYNARVSVRDTDLSTLTDESGGYILRNVPAGPTVLKVFYTGLDVQEIQVAIIPGQSVIQDFSLTSEARYGHVDVVKLDAFVVASSREMDASALAINERRVAPNIKNVLATDTFGNITENNVAEFMKFLPGVTVEFVDASPNTVSVRGLASNLTGVSIDGAVTANAHASGTNRAFEFKQVSLNNFSRIEVTKVPLPSSPADSMGGSINMVSKSAFEKSKPEFNYRLFVSTNSSEVTLKRTPFPSDSRTFKTLPGAEFTYSLPVTKDFGIVLTASSSSQYNIQSGVRTTFNGNNAGTNATFAKPYLQQYLLVDAPKYRFHNSVSAKADWRITPHGVLSAGGQVGFFMDVNRNLTFTSSAGTAGTPTPATGQALTFGDDFVIGATGRGSVAQTQGYHNTSGQLKAGNLRYRFDDGKWRIDTGGSISYSKSWNRPQKYGYFSNVTVTTFDPVRVSLLGFHDFDISSVQAFDNNNKEVDIYNIKNFKVTTANIGTLDVIDKMETADLNVRRQFDTFSMPTALQFGSAFRRQTRDRTSSSINWTYNGVNGDLSAERYLTTVYSSGELRGMKAVPWVSSHLVYDAFTKNPALFTKTAAQIVAEEGAWITNSQYVQEAVTAHYGQGEVRLFKNRLQILGGVRFEETTDKGAGPLTDPNAVFVRNADGTFAHNAANQRIRKAEAGAAGSLEELRLTRKERGNPVRKTFNDFYPSLHLTANVKENFLIRLAYAETYGRPNLSEILPNTTINEADVANTGDPSVVLGAISIVNSGLKPWSAKNYDLSAEYYTKQGGVFSVGAFRKDIQDFFGSAVRIATLADTQELGLDPRYVNWRVTTKYNSGNARVTGFEFDARHSLIGLGQWGSYFVLFANATKLKLEGAPDADFRGFTPESANWGFTYSRRPVTIMARWNYRGVSKADAIPTSGPDGFIYNPARAPLDLNVDFQYKRGLSFFANARNVFNEQTRQERRGSQTPEYARFYATTDYGVQYAIGIKGTF